MANPTAREQELLELINRMRINPAAELPLLLNSADPQVANALTYFNVDRNLLTTQWSTLTAAAPLAWSSQLNDVAVTHNQKMIQYDQQSHQVGSYNNSGNLVTAYEPNISGRISAVNYNFTYAGENIFAYANSIFEAHAALAIDWGGSAATGGIQSPAGHRNNMMSSNFREVGIGVTPETNPSTQVGPLVITQDFGNRSALNGKAWLLGVAFQDTNKNGWYEAGEGLSDVQVQITGINGTTFSDTLTVGTAGGFQDLLNPGQYKIDFSRNGVVISSKTTLISANSPANVKIDLVLPVLNIATRNDLNGDGKSDILWRNTDGRVALWQMSGSTVTTGSTFATVSTDWKISSSGDFNGDNKSDILWRNNDGRVALWTMDGATKTSGTVIATVSTDWKIAGTADFGGDGKADILWRNDNGQMAIWQMDGATQGASAVVATVDTAWKIAGTGDFGGDGKSDILWRKNDGSVALWQMDGLNILSQNFLNPYPTVDNSWKIAGTGDFNGDSKADILWRNDDGRVNIWLMDGANVLATGPVPQAPTVDNSWKISGTGDFNGDGKADILWRNTNGSTNVWEMNGSTLLANNSTNPYPVVSSDWSIAAPII